MVASNVQVHTLDLLAVLELILGRLDRCCFNEVPR